MQLLGVVFLAVVDEVVVQPEEVRGHRLLLEAQMEAAYLEPQVSEALHALLVHLTGLLSVVLGVDNLSHPTRGVFVIHQLLPSITGLFVSLEMLHQ